MLPGSSAGNLLVNADCELKICDFGLARGFAANGNEEKGGPGIMTECALCCRSYPADDMEDG